jgi:hypothetical protein
MNLVSNSTLLDTRALVTSSGLFNAKWYLARYSDLIRPDIDPIDDFLLYGAGVTRRVARRIVVPSRWGDSRAQRVSSSSCSVRSASCQKSLALGPPKSLGNKESSGKFKYPLRSKKGQILGSLAFFAFAHSILDDPYISTNIVTKPWLSPTGKDDSATIEQLSSGVRPNVSRGTFCGRLDVRIAKERRNAAHKEISATPHQECTQYHSAGYT